MTTSLWVSLVVGAVAFAGTQISGYMQRKQMRQNELYRRDPSVGLMPPPHPVTLFLKKNFWQFVFYGLGALDLFEGFRGPDPPTRTSILNIALGVGWLFYAFLTRVTDGLMRVMEGHSEIFRELIKASSVQAEVTKIIVEKTIDRRVEDDPPIPSKDGGDEEK
jgi:hypothetical protein